MSKNKSSNVIEEVPLQDKVKNMLILHWSYI